MEYYLDTADVAAIRELKSVIDFAGVTTNPTILSKEKREPLDTIAELIELLDEDQKLFVQVVATDYEGIMEEAHFIQGLRQKNIYVKIPVTQEGLKAIRQCHKEGIGTLATAIYSANSGFMAALNGATYLAPYVNRMCNLGDGISEVIELNEMLAVQGLETKVLAASFKNARQVQELIVAGIPALTLPVDVVKAMMIHPSTTLAVDEFSANWQKAFGRNGLRT